MIYFLSLCWTVYLCGMLYKDLTGHFLSFSSYSNTGAVLILLGFVMYSLVNIRNFPGYFMYSCMPFSGNTKMIMTSFGLYFPWIFAGDSRDPKGYLITSQFVDPFQPLM